MPRPKLYPSKWHAQDHGSWRELRPGVVQCTWRPEGKTGKQRKKNFAGNGDDADAFLRRQYELRTRQKVGLAVSLDWAEIGERYSERLAARGCVEAYHSAVLGLLRDFAAHCAVSPTDVQPLHIDNWLETLSYQAQENERPGWAATCNRKRAMLGAFFRWLYRRRLIATNPVGATEAFRQDEHMRRNLSPDEYARVWAVSEPAVQDLMDFLLLTGCRFGEAAAMKRGHVNGGVWIIQDRKGKNDLAIPLPALLLEIILRQPTHTDGLVWHKSVDPKPQTRDRGGRPVDTAQPIDAYWLRKVLMERCRWAEMVASATAKNACEAAGIDYFTAHDLRHAAASWADNAGANTRAVQKLLGHKRVTTTELYAHGSGTDVAKRVQEMLMTVRTKAMQDLA